MHILRFNMHFCHSFAVKFSNKFAFPLYGLVQRAYKVNGFFFLFGLKCSPTIGVAMLLSMEFHAQMNNTKQSRAKNVYNRYNENGKEFCCIISALCCCTIPIFCSSFLCDDDIIAFILGCEWSTPSLLPRTTFHHFVRVVLLFFRSHCDIFIFLQMLGVWNANQLCANVK